MVAERTMLQEKLGQVNTRNVGHGRREEDTSPEKEFGPDLRDVALQTLRLLWVSAPSMFNTVKAAARLRQAR